ncbi:MAG: threonine-phosphate decarboxylase CobD [Pseudomonadota bacterium]
MRDHGGNLDRARAIYGGADWVDLSTGINPIAYEMPYLSAAALAALPTREDVASLEMIAATAYDTSAEIVALAGAQAAIQLAPRLRPAGRAAVLSPSYNEHAASLKRQGWGVTEALELDDMSGADIAVVVNPNNPDGRRWTHETLIGLAERVGFLIVDESFADPHPELSLVPFIGDLGERILVMRSFGKFYGLAGLRLGFALGGPETIAHLRALAGPWAVNGPAIVAGRAALSDAAWRAETTTRLNRDAARLDALAKKAGWRLVGGTALFRTYDTPDAAAAQGRLARSAIWSRIFPYSATWMRLGLPGTESAWERMATALTRGVE